MTREHPGWEEILRAAIGPYEDRCVGFLSAGQPPGERTRNYLLALVLGVGKVPRRFYHSGSRALDEDERVAHPAIR